MSSRAPVESEAALDVVEASANGEGGRGEHDGIEAVEERLAQDGGDVDGRGLEEDVLRPRAKLCPRFCVRRGARSSRRCFFSSALHKEGELGVEFVGAANEVVDLVGLGGMSLQLGVELADDVLEADELGAELFEKLLALAEGEATVAFRQAARRKTASARASARRAARDRWR